MSNTLCSFCSNEGCEENNIVECSEDGDTILLTYLQQKIILFFSLNIAFNYVLLNFPSLALTDISVRSYRFLTLKRFV